MLLQHFSYMQLPSSNIRTLMHAIIGYDHLSESLAIYLSQIWPVKASHNERGGGGVLYDVIGEDEGGTLFRKTFARVLNGSPMCLFMQGYRQYSLGN